MTYRDRREARADRLDGWADKRETRGQASVDQARARADLIPFGQPMMPGHHSYKGDVAYRGRIQSGYRRGFADLDKAESMRSRAGNIRSQAGHAIYTDDHDAIDKLRERIAGLEAERARIRAYNATCRKGAPDLTLLDDKQRDDLATVARVCPYQLGKGGAFPSYGLSNLSGNITKQRARLAQLEQGTRT